MQASFSNEDNCKNDILLISKCKTANVTVHEGKRQKNIQGIKPYHQHQRKNCLKGMKSKVNLNKKSVSKLKINQQSNKQNKINQLIVQFKNKQAELFDQKNHQTQLFKLQIQNQKKQTGYINAQQQLVLNVTKQKQKINSSCDSSKQSQKSLNIKIKSLLMPQNLKIKNFNGFQKSHYNKFQILNKLSVIKKKQDELMKKSFQKQKLFCNQNIDSFTKQSKNYKLNKTKGDKILFQDSKQFTNGCLNLTSQSFYSKAKIDFQPETSYLKNYMKTYSSKSLKVKSISRSVNYFQRLFRQQSQNKQKSNVNINLQQFCHKIQESYLRNENKTFHHICKQNKHPQNIYSTCWSPCSSIKTINKNQQEQFFKYPQRQQDSKQMQCQRNDTKRKMKKEKLTTKLQPWINELDSYQTYEFQQ